MLTVVNLKKEPYDIYIGRGSPFGNPYVIGVDGDRETVIMKYEEYARSSPVIMNHIKSLCHKGDARLGCYCKPLSCHGDIIVKIFEELCKSQKV